jgi:hypothetical protein
MDLPTSANELHSKRPSRPSMPRWDVYLFAATTVWLVCDALFTGSIGNLHLGNFEDYRKALELSNQVILTSTYPADFGYPPPGVLGRAVLGHGGLVVTGVVWGLLMGLSLLAIPSLIHRLLDVTKRRELVILRIIPFVCVFYAVQWDFRALNVNILYLTMLLVYVTLWKMDRRSAAGIVLALSVATKVYSLLLFPYLILHRRWAILTWASIGLVILFAVLPAAALGPQQALAVTISWLEAARITSDANFPMQFGSYQVSLHSVLLTWFGPIGAMHNVPDIAPLLSRSPAQILSLTRVVQGLLLGSVTLFLILDRLKAKKQISAISELRNLALLSITALPLSGMFQPHHAVVLWLAAAIITLKYLQFSSFRGGKPWLMCLLLPPMIVHVLPGGAWKALGINLWLATWMVALMLTSRPTVPSEPNG